MSAAAAAVPSRARRESEASTSANLRVWELPTVERTTGPEGLKAAAGFSSRSNDASLSVPELRCKGTARRAWLPQAMQSNAMDILSMAVPVWKIGNSDNWFEQSTPSLRTKIP
mmetsp:Transcript_14246/g.26478  ORF Transcript_14246/g.26478 Transcript_14246/m.26478 type:complete len:113 (+) Transcript_14246:921-1259(+)